MTISLSSTVFDTYLFLVSPSGAVVAENDDSGGTTNSNLAFTLTSTGTWVVEVTSFGGDVTGTYSLSLQCSGGTGCSSQSLSCGGSASGSLTTADCTQGQRGTGHYTDVYQFSGTQGQLVTVTLSSSAFDTYLILVDPSGAAVTSDDDGGGGTNSRISFTLTSAGTWRIEATSYGQSQTGAYSINLQCSGGGGGGGGGGSCSEQSLSCNGNTSGTLATTDCTQGQRGSSFYTDVYQFSGTQGQQVTIDLTSSAFDTFLYLVGPSGSVEAADDDGGSSTNSRISFTLTATGTWRVQATSYGQGATGAYSLALQCSGGGGGSCADQSISCGGNLSGGLASSDCTQGQRGSSFYADTYQFSGTQGQQVTIDLSSSAFDAYLYLLSPSGAVAASDDDSGGSGNSKVTHTLTTSGTWRIQATSYAQGATGAYSLALRCSGGSGGTSPVRLITTYDSGDVSDQAHQVGLFFDPSDSSLLIEVRANANLNWNDIIEAGNLNVSIPKDLRVDWSRMGLYVSQTLTASEVSQLGNWANFCFYKQYPQRFSPQTIESLTEAASSGIDRGMSLGITMVESIADKTVVGPAIETWEFMSSFLSNYYPNKRWVGDRNGVYPQFASGGREASGEFFGNSRRVVSFKWVPTDWLFGFIDRGYLVVTVKLPLQNWSAAYSPIYVFGQLKVHDAFDTPFVTLFSRSITYQQTQP